MLPQNIKQLLFERKVSKTDFAATLGITRATLDGYLNGKVPMPADKIKQTSDFFGVSIGLLFGETEKREKSIQEAIKKQQVQINRLSKQIDIIANYLQIKNSIKR